MGASFAIAYTVKNEEDLLLHNIAYHRALGCVKFYVFWDGTTDNSPQLLKGVPDIQASQSLHPTELLNPPAWISSISCVWDKDMDVRKRINTFFAAKMAANEGIEWLVSIDPDELLYLQANVEPSEAIAEEIFGDPKLAGVDQILFRNLEALPPLDHGKGRILPFVATSLFLTRHPRAEFFWRLLSAFLLRATRSPRAQAWGDYLFFFAFLRGALPRLIRDPLDGTRIPCSYFLGYSNFKCAVRTSVSVDLEFRIHKWIRSSRRPVSRYIGNVLHYDLCDAEYFSRKFRQRSDSMLLQVFFVRYRLGKISRTLSTARLRDFFNEWIALDRGPTAEKLLSRGTAVRVDVVRKFFSESLLDRSDTTPNS